MKKKYLWKIISFVLALASLLCIAAICLRLRPQKPPKLSQVSEDVPVEEPPVEKEKAELPVDFDALQKVNPEIYAWIRIPGTVVDYPIVQREGEDQKFYLTHDYTATKKHGGSIFTEHYNTTDFEDFDTIIYGHNLNSGQMFHDIRYFADPEFFEEYDEFYIYMPGKIMTCKIISCYEYDDRHLLGVYDFTEEEDRQAYLEEITNPRSMDALVREDIPLTTEDRLVTLSTCIKGKPKNRRLVQAVIAEETEAEYRGAADGTAETEEN